MYGQQKRNIIHKSSTAYEQDHSDQRDELAPFHLDRPLSKPTHWTFGVTPPCRAPSAGWPRAPRPSLSDGRTGGAAVAAKVEEIDVVAARPSTTCRRA